VHETDGSQRTASLEEEKEKNLSNNNNQLEHPYIEEKDDSRYISLNRLFAVLI